MNCEIKKIEWHKDELRPNRWECEPPSRLFQPFIQFCVPDRLKQCFCEGKDEDRKMILYEYSDNDWGENEIGEFNTFEEAVKYAQQYFEEIVKECLIEVD